MRLSQDCKQPLFDSFSAYFWTSPYPTLRNRDFRKIQKHAIPHFGMTS